MNFEAGLKRDKNLFGKYDFVFVVIGRFQEEVASVHPSSQWAGDGVGKCKLCHGSDTSVALEMLYLPTPDL